MTKIVVGILGTIGALVMLFEYPTSLNHPAGAAAGSAGTRSGADGGSVAAGGTKVMGDPASTRWGVVQVAITVANGKIMAADAVLSPHDNPTSAKINDFAVPQLNQAVMATQGANVASVSGASVTSGGYLESLHSAMVKAGM